VTRTIQQWTEILEPLGTLEAAHAILGDLIDYRMHGNHLSEDIEQLANALAAYQRLDR
jgi:hypothetical protein